MAEYQHERVERGPVTGEFASTIKRTSWGAIFAGTFVVLAVTVLLGILGVAIGVTVLGATDDPGDAATPVGIGAMIWWVITWLAALFAGGWVSGRLAGVFRGLDGALHGLVTWAFATVAGLFFMFSIMGAVIGGAWNIVATAAEIAAPVAAEAVAGGDQQTQQIKGQARQLLIERGMDGEPMAGEEPQGYDELSQALDQMLQQDQPTEAEREEVVDVIVRHTDLTRQQARRRVNQWVEQQQANGPAAEAGQWQPQTGQQIDPQQQMRRAREAAPEVAEQATQAMAVASWWIFLMLLLGAVAAVLGGKLGTPGRDVYARA